MGKRKPQKCSFCGKLVQNLSRHKREVHNMDTLECKLGDYINGAKKAPKRLVKFCPLSPCKRKQKPIFQLHRHLQSEIHKLKPSTRPYDDALRSATRVHLNDVEERLKAKVSASGDEKKEEISSSSEDSSERRKRDENNQRKCKKRDKQEVNDKLELKPSSHQKNEEKKKKDECDVNKEKVEGMEKSVHTLSDEEYDALAEEVWEQTKHVGVPEETSCKDNIVEIVSSNDSDISEFLPTDSDERTDNTDTSHNSTAESSLTDTSALSDERDELLTELVEMNGEENCRGSSFLDGDIPWKRCVNTFIKAKHHKGYIFKSSSECEANLLAEVTKMQDYEMKDILEDNSDNDDVLYEEWVPSEVGCTRKEEHESDEMLQQFYEWLVEVDGGYRDEKSAKQYQSQVKSVIHKLKEYSDDEKKQLSCSELLTLEGQEGVTLLKKWLTDAVKQYQPGTVRCYLMSIRLFYKFLSQEGKTTVQEIVNSRRDLMTSWSAAQKKKSLKRRLQKNDEDYEKILSGEALHQVCHGNQRIQTIKKLGKTCATRDDGQNSFMVNDKSYCEVRDYLITRLTIDNSGRSGVASNMTLEEFKEAVFYEGNEEDEARYRVLVKEHKTSVLYGAAVVWVYSDLYKMIEMYIKTLRQQVTQANPTINNVFVSSNGMSLTSSQISTSIWRTFQREKIELNGRISATTIRKSLATGVHIHMPQDKEKLAALAQHKPQTQRNYYCVHDKVTDTDLGRRAVSKFVSMKAKDMKDTAVKVTHVEWTIDEEDCLKKIFSDEINAGGITNEVVRDKLGASNILVHHTLKAVVLKLKHMREKHMERCAFHKTKKIHTTKS